MFTACPLDIIVKLCGAKLYFPRNIVKSKVVTADGRRDIMG